MCCVFGNSVLSVNPVVCWWVVQITAGVTDVYRKRVWCGIPWAGKIEDINTQFYTHTHMLLRFPTTRKQDSIHSSRCYWHTWLPSGILIKNKRTKSESEKTQSSTLNTLSQTPMCGFSTCLKEIRRLCKARANVNSQTDKHEPSAGLHPQAQRSYFTTVTENTMPAVSCRSKAVIWWNTCTQSHNLTSANSSLL